MIRHEIGKTYFKMRGYTGEPKDWSKVEVYLMRFMQFKTDEVQRWDDESWKEAYKIVKKYFNKRPIIESNNRG